MNERHINMRAGRLLPAVLLCTFVAAGAALFLFYAYRQGRIGVVVKLEGQQIRARMAASFPVTAEIDQVLTVPVKGSASFRVPVNQAVTVPFKKRLTVPVELETRVPVDLEVPLKIEIPIETKVFIDTEVETSVLGIPLKVPVKGYFPIRATIPINQNIPVHDEVELKLKTPVKADIDDSFEIPINNLFSVDVPLDTKITVPFKEHVVANVSLDGAVANQIPNLYILDNAIEIGLDKIRLVWRKE